MADITQAATGGGVTFTANTTAADIWMREVYGDPLVTFSISSQQLEAREFRQSAAVNGLTIEAL